MNEETLAIQEMFPVSQVPICGTLPKSTDGVHYYVAGDGLWRLVRTPWLSALAPVAVSRKGVTPFGDLEEHVQVTASPPKHLWIDFLADAKKQFPLECAGVFAWNAGDGSWRYVPRNPLRATGSFIAYEEPALGADEIAVVDIHSHGRHAAFFSSTDDEDDRGAIKISMVVGNVDDVVTLAGRIVVLDHQYPLAVDGDGQWQIGARA